MCDHSYKTHMWEWATDQTYPKRPRTPTCPLVAASHEYLWYYYRDSPCTFCHVKCKEYSTKWQRLREANPIFAARLYNVGCARLT